jgi:hypothetical protein
MPLLRRVAPSGSNLTLVPTSDSLDNFVGISGQCEGFRFGVVFDDEAIDGGLQIDDRYEDAAFQSPLGELGEEALDCVEPGR